MAGKDRCSQPPASRRRPERSYWCNRCMTQIIAPFDLSSRRETSVERYQSLTLLRTTSELAVFRLDNVVENNDVPSAPGNRPRNRSPRGGPPPAVVRKSYAGRTFGARSSCREKCLDTTPTALSRGKSRARSPDNCSARIADAYEVQRRIAAQHPGDPKSPRSFFDLPLRGGRLTSRRWHEPFATRRSW